jgi:hypothetical protein
MASAGTVQRAIDSTENNLAGLADQHMGRGTSISGGIGNIAMGDWSSICGGGSNFTGLDFTAKGTAATITGGYGNKVEGDYASISGGLNRTAPNQYNWAAGSFLENQ